jgi:dsDNA-specific endonuclease/ATPase MutS2
MKFDAAKIKLQPTYTFYIFVRKKNMDTKLTIRLNENVIERAKIFAQNNNISLSKLIESYLDLVTRKKSEAIGITPLVESLTGVIELPENYDYQKEYTDYLNKKYE